MAFNFGTPISASTPAFNFGGASTSAFGATATPTLNKTSSTPLFGTPAPVSSSSLFGASSTPAFSFSTPSSQPAQSPSLFGASAPASTPAFSFSSPLSGGGAAAGGMPATTTSLFGQQVQQQPQQQQTSGIVQPDDSALKEIQGIKDSYVPGAGNYRHRFKYLFLNVVENPAARIKPPEVDELQWREALRRAGGPDNPDKLWPVQAQGFSGLMARKAAQDEALKQHAERLQAVQENISALASRHEAVLKTQLDSVKKRHAALSQQLLRVLRFVDGLEGRFAHAMGYRSASSRESLQNLFKQLAAIESALAPGTSGGLQAKADAVIAAARQRVSAGPTNSLESTVTAIDPDSLNSAYAVLSEYAEALGKMQAVLKRSQRDIAVLQSLKDSEYA